MLAKIDAQLNKLTMYKVVVYSLQLYVILAFILTVTGQIGVSARGIVVSYVVLMVGCFLTNFGLSKALKVSVNSESGVITALILVLILPPPTTVGLTARILLTGILAIASKFFLKWRGVNLFNPAAIGALIVSVAHILPATWWVGNPAMAIPVIIFGLLILRKIRRFSLFVAFVIAATLTTLYVSIGLGDQSLSSTLHDTFLSGPLLFLGTIMLTEPSTLPVTRYYQVLYGALVGVVFSASIGIGRISSTPQVALIVGNIFTILAVQRFGAQLILKRRTQVGPNLYDLAFALPSGRTLPFTPGQYLEWTLMHPKTDIRGNRRTFSIASSPEDNEVHIGIKSYEPSSSFKKALLALEPGAAIRAGHPAGDFMLPHDPKTPVVMIAGGIGITPFHSMIKHLVDSTEQRDVTLLYLAAKQEEFAYQDTFSAAERLGIKTIYSTERLKPEDLQNLITKDKDQKFYISGPDGLVRAYQKMLLGLGVARRSVKTDHFSGY
jgi:ferredoxin-NADP reductase/Na+-translocating ferredoxin:NAD+ oxidoreductase RnfD subunit